MASGKALRKVAEKKFVKELDRGLWQVWLRDGRTKLLENSILSSYLFYAVLEFTFNI